MSEKRKRPKVRYVAGGSMVYVMKTKNRPILFAVAEDSFITGIGAESRARRIAAALNLHEAVRRGEVC